MSKNTQIGPPWNITKLLNWTESYLKNTEATSPRLDAELLLASVLNLERLQLYMRFDQPVMPEELAEYRALIKRRAKGEPVAYILGRRAFYNIELKCDRRALIPRLETEVLIDVVLERLPADTRTIIDVGTGTGAIGISLALECPEVNVILTDISVEALDLAKENVTLHELTHRVGLLSGDLLKAVPNHREFEVCVSNPPYISEKTRSEVSQNVSEFEPHLALFAGNDGLEFIGELTAQAFERLPQGGLYAIEIGYDQGDSVPVLFENIGFHDIELRHDYSGNPRVVSGIKI